MQQRSLAQSYALAAGVVLVAAGIAGFFYNGTFTSNEAVHDDILGIFSVNGWSNTLHILTGVLGLAWASDLTRSRAYAWGAGALYVALGLWGFILGNGESILSIVPVNGADNVAHLLIGVAGLLAGVATGLAPGRTAVAA